MVEKILICDERIGLVCNPLYLHIITILTHDGGFRSLWLFCKPFQSERQRCAFREYKRLCFPRSFLSSLAECKQKNVDALSGLESCGWYWFEYYFEWSSFISIHRKIFDGICYSVKKRENMEENGKLNEEKRVYKVETRIIHRSLLQ